MWPTVSASTAHHHTRLMSTNRPTHVCTVYRLRVRVCNTFVCWCCDLHLRVAHRACDRGYTLFIARRIDRGGRNTQHVSMLLFHGTRLRTARKLRGHGWLAAGGYNGHLIKPNNVRTHRPCKSIACAHAQICTHSYSGFNDASAAKPASRGFRASRQPQTATTN